MSLLLHGVVRAGHQRSVPLVTWDDPASPPRPRMRPAMLDGLVEVHACLRFDEEEALVAAHDERLSGTRSTYDLVTWRRARSDALLAPVAAAARGQVLLPDRVPTEERRAFLLPHEDVASARAVITALTHLAGVETECTGPLPPVSFVPAPPI